MNPSLPRPSSRLGSAQFKRAAALALALASLSGCANLEGRPRTLAEGLLVGCLIGTGAGAAAGGVEGAAIGLVAGCLSGLGIGEAIANRQDRYASLEAVLDGRLDDLRARNLALQEYNEVLQNDVIALEQMRRDAYAGIRGYRQRLAQARPALRGLATHKANERRLVQKQLAVVDYNLRSSRLSQQDRQDLYSMRGELLTADRQIQVILNGLARI